MQAWQLQFVLQIKYNLAQFTKYRLEIAYIFLILGIKQGIKGINYNGK